VTESSPGGPDGKAGFTRRRFIIGTAGVSAAAALGGTVVRAPRAAAAGPPSGPPTTTVPLPTTTKPEQLLLTWGADPARDVTVSWSAPGTVPQPAPVLAVSAKPITAGNPGRLIKLPDPRPLDVTQRYGEAASVSFTDTLNGQTTYCYHVQLKGLKPGTRYYYQVTDGAAEPSVAGSSFETAPAGRAKFRFSSYGDLATPSWDLNTSGNIWHESCDNSWYAVTAIENPGDGKGAPLFHLLNGDLCYANLDVDNAPGVWRDFGNNVARSAANRPWMPALGNHEAEFGTDTISGHPSHAPGGIAAQGAAGNYWNGPYGFGHYLSRFLLPDNGVTNWDGNRLRGNFYAFQVGTVMFISVDADDVIYQDGAANYVIDTANTAPETTTTGASIPNGTTAYNRFYTGGLTHDAKDNSLVPDYASGGPTCRRSGWTRRWPRRATSTTTSGPTRSAASTPGRTAPSRRPTPARPRERPSTPGGRRWRPPSRTTSTARRGGTPPRARCTWCSAAAAPTGRPTPTARMPPTTSRRPRSSPRATPSSAARRPGSSRTAPTRSRTRPGRRPSTRPTPTATRSSTSTPAGAAGRPRSRSSTSRSRR